ncbi:S1/P1 nuclease [Bradyrhizobium sp. SZCCHNS1054]|uniref:S1/P1 nuclease n=1 Tax=Bradyrhizobium sp. SZCCHNS1054 TaxID=3057301 RepID=UPI002916A5CF|nr:S1/P1 nuclease [Bradyrhizobium sp. SZCCHNS1054]
MKRFIAILSLLFLPLSDAWAWGQEGHSIVAEVAQHRISAATLDKIGKLLAAESGSNAVSLASIASWADDYKFEPAGKDTSGWHFVNIPDDQPSYNQARDCSKPCLVSAIEKTKQTLANCSATPDSRRLALKMLVHLVGDIHQPLHTTDRTDVYTSKDDRGGNDVPVTFFGKTSNLHEVWDTGIIMRTVYAWGSYVTRLETSWFPGRDLSSLTGGSTADWANEAHQLAHDVAYDAPDDGILGVKYFTKASPVVDRQLAVAGVRLARILDQAMASCS